MRKHAKGPWEWSENLLVSQEKPYDVVLRLQTSFRPLKAESALVAAAPDILEALEAALDAECGKKCRCEQGWHAVAKAAVAKARGTP